MSNRTVARRYFSVKNSGLKLGHLDGLKYLARGKFPINQAAGFTSPYQLEIGKLVRFNDSGNQASIDAGDLVLSGTAVGSYINPAYYITDNNNNPFPKSNGLVAIYRVIGSGVIRLGFTSNATMASSTQSGFLINGSGLQYMGNGSFNFNIHSWSNLATYLIAVIQKTTGLEFWVKGNDLAGWKPLFAETNSWTVATNIYPSISTAGAVTARIGDFWLYQALSGRLINGTHIISSANPNTTILTAKTNNLFHLQGVVPTGAANRKLELRYRQLDANNYLLTRIEWNGSNYQFVTGHVIAGVETLQGSPIASVASVGNTFRIEVQINGSNNRFYTTGGTTWAKRYADIVDASGSSNLGVSVNNDGFTSTALTVWDLDDSEMNTILDSIAA